jgi:Short C-terminal domain
MEADDRNSQEGGAPAGPDPTEPQDVVTASAPEPATGSEASPDVAATAPATKISRGRLIGVDVLIGVTTLLLVVAIFATWANRLLFSPDNWSKTSTQLLQNENVRSTTANYVVDQLYANVNVAGVLKQALPTQFQGLAGPAAGALRNAAVSGTELALSRPRVQQLWAEANRAADQTFVDIVNGKKGTVGVNQGAVTLNLASIANNIASRLGLPSDIASKLPPNVANLVIFKSDQLKYVQNGGKAIKGLAFWLLVIVPLLYILALFLAKGHRRRTLMTIGFAGIFAGVLVIAGRSILQGQVTNALTSDASLQATIHDVYGIATAILKDVASGAIFTGILLVAAAWFAGPARPAHASRRVIAPFLREQAVATYGIVAGLLILLFIWDPIPATSKPIGILVFTVLAFLGAYLLIQQTAVEFPEARSGAATHAIRTRMASMRERRESKRGSSAPAGPTTAEQLKQLADLRDSGAINPEEYQSAKEKLLSG